MPNPPVASARLGAVNLMLSTISEAPVNQLSPSPTPEVAFAVARLDEIDREVQSQGWHFNTELGISYTPDISGIITLPSEVVQVSNQRYPQYTQRGQELYDLKNHTNVFASPVTLDVVYLLDFDLTPEPFRYYVTIRAARVFQDRFQGSAAIHRYTQEDEFRARSSLERSQSATQPLTLLDNPDVARVLHRRYPRLPGL